MRIETVPCLSDNLSYLVIDDQTHTCVVIDPSEARPFLETIRNQGLRLIAIMTTHHHYDHIGGLSEFPEVPVWSSKRDLERVPGAGHAQSHPSFDDGAEKTWAELGADPLLAPVTIHFRALAIPGHTEGQMALIFTDGAVNGTSSTSNATSGAHVFVGDTLFALGCGRCLEGTAEILFASLQKLKALPQDARLYFGHEYTEKNALFWLSHAAKDADLVQPEQIKKILLDEKSAPFPKPAPTVNEETDRNPFLKIKNASDFRRWRELRNIF